MYPWLSTTFSGLVKRFEEGQLHHGLLFMGPGKLGKTELCQSLAAKLLCSSGSNQQSGFLDPVNNDEACGNCKSCQLIAAKSHPDLNIVLSEKSQIGIDLIRSAISKLTQTSQLGGNKVLVIPNIELMSESASNSLLKTLEEPTQNTYLLLTSNEPQKLLATVLSRCEKIAITHPRYEESVAWLKSKGALIATEDELQACGHSPLRYLEQLNNEDSLTYQDFITDISALESRASDSLRVAQKWKEDSPRALQWLGQYFMRKYKDSSDEMDYKSYIDCIEKSKLMGHLGLNKVVLIEALFSRV
ncbi:DNA polymerase III subunit [Glaciecola sp. MH2013]|uniref:DNA polymerase III subunit n=1 Tax=Glaciecola sp. MH2013 TaxID=2785524 RepID=UPI0018A044A0|nr:DNA polymerase III subunit [Glaciecola sp. MH2013]MBF7072907.1 DNA polymerase III subunit [Glaciecola sp. MH2013]